MKTNYDWSTYKWCHGSNNTLTKYCTNSSYGTVDNKTTLDPEDDVASEKWGANWRMPTEDEFNELRDKCSWTLYSINGVYGQKVTGPNGNYIFLPAAGYRDGMVVHWGGSDGSYGSASGHENYSSLVYIFNFSVEGDHGWGSFKRSLGVCVRPVTDK